MMRKAKTVMLLALSTFLIVLSVEVALTGPKVRATIEKIDGLVDQAKDAAKKTDEAMTNIRDASRAWNQQSKDQAKLVSATEKAAQQAIANLDLMVQHTDFQLNQQVLPQMRAAIEANGAQLIELEKTATTSFTAIAEESSKVMQAAAIDLSDPQIKLAIDNMAVATQNAATATQEGAAAMAKVHAGVEYEVNELMKPVRKVKVIGEEIVRLIGKFLGY